MVEWSNFTDSFHTVYLVEWEPEKQVFKSSELEYVYTSVSVSVRECIINVGVFV